MAPLIVAMNSHFSLKGIKLEISCSHPSCWPTPMLICTALSGLSELHFTKSRVRDNPKKMYFHEDMSKSDIHMYIF